MVNSGNRPKIEIEKTTSEWVWDIVGYLCYAGSILFLLVIWEKLPKEVPAHYNALGEIDRWGSKWELILLPCIGAFMIFFMKVLERFPELHNYPKRFHESNARQFYLQSRKMINQLKNLCVIIFSLLLFESVSIALGWGSGFGIWFLPITIFVGISIVVGIIKQRKIQ
ncbi:DUF1648 domain-containing protein [Brevibacillus reuszeri]|uniref:DUF1648 domain-containing protein n=1 Tax=Brevibacillus reuszeri TaxID=54915 RepID=UPI00289ED457|nr:DUF1648 domain-containing protein [Brevibacillus reuszeri]